MCYFITVAVEGDKASILERLVPRGVAVEPVANASVAGHLPRLHRAYVVTSGWCSCALFSEKPAGSPEKLRRKYRKKGWSEAKIERAIASASHVGADRTEEAGLERGIRDFLATVAKEAGEVSVLAHWYSGEVESERLDVRLGRMLTVDEMRAGRFVMAVDELLTVKAP